MSAACGPPPAGTTSTQSPIAAVLQLGIAATCEITSIDGERLVPAPRTRDVLVGQTLVFTSRIAAPAGFTLAPAPYTYTWSSLGTPPLTGRETTNNLQSAIQHSYSAPGTVLVGADVTGGGGTLGVSDTCSVTVRPRP